MADTKYSALPVATSVSPADLICVAQGGVSKQATASLVTKANASTNASTSAQTVTGAAEAYLTGSGITVPAGIWTAGTSYWCVWDMAKTAAGVAILQINVRIGTSGTNSDAAVLAWTAGVAQTAATDQGRFEVLLNVRTTGTAATITALVNVMRIAATAVGFFATAVQCIPGIGAATTTFNSTTATKIGVSVLGGTSFVGTVQLVQSELKIP